MKKKILCCIGPEGMGHHMCTDIFESEWKNVGKFDHIFTGLNHYWNNSFIDNLDFSLNYIIMKAMNHPATYFVYTPSSPYDNPRDSLRRPDLLEFYRKFSNAFDLIILNLYRNPVNATYSLVRRGWFQTNDPRVKNQMLSQAKIVEDNLLFHRAHLSLIGEENWKTLCYEDIVEDPFSFAGSLAEFTSVPEDRVINGLKKVKKSGVQIPESDMKLLKRFFTAERLSLWEDFFLSNKLRVHSKINTQTFLGRANLF